MRLRFLFAALLVLLASCGYPSRAHAQVPDPVLAAQAPMPGSDHRYIGIGAESVNPADGSVSFNLPIKTPPGRMLSFPFSITYASSEQFSLSTHGSNSSLSWDPIVASPYFVHGWGYQLPSYSGQVFTKSVDPDPGHPNITLTCVGARNYIFRGFDGVQRNLTLSNTWPNPSNQATDTACHPSFVNGGRHGFAASAPPSYAPSATQPALTVTDPSGTQYLFPQMVVSSPTDPSSVAFWGVLAQSITDHNGNQISYAGATNGGTGLENTGFTVPAGSY